MGDPVLILGIETSTAQVGVAIGGHEGVLAQAHSVRGRRHAESLAPTIDFVRRQARVDLHEISCVAVDVGLDLARLDTKTFFVKNIGANPINAARLEATNIPAEMRNSNDWELVDSTTFQFLAAGSVKSKQIAGDSRRYWRMQVSSTNGATVIANVTGR